VYTKHQERIKKLKQTDGRTEGEPQEKSRIRLSKEEKVKSIKKLSGTRGLVHGLEPLILLLHKKKLPQKKENWQDWKKGDHAHLILGKCSRGKA